MGITVKRNQKQIKTQNMNKKRVCLDILKEK